MEVITKDPGRLEKQLADPEDALYQYILEDRVAECERIKNLIEAVVARELAGLELIKVLKAR